MNLYELDELINCLINENNPNNNELIAFYKKKRVKLVETIKQQLYSEITGL
jgi:hypothetical protein